MSISPKSLGLQQVAAPGTPQPIAVVSTQTKRAVLTPIKTLPSTANVGNIYLGTSTMVKATGVGVYRILTPTTLPVLLERGRSTGEFVDLSQWYIDADNGTDGLLVGYDGE